MGTTVSLNPDAHELFMEVIPAIQAILEMGVIPLREEIRELDEAAYEAIRAATGSVLRPLYVVAAEDEAIYEPGRTMNVMLPQDLPKIFKGIDFFERYAKTHKIPIRDRQRVFDHAKKRVPRLIIGQAGRESIASGESPEKIRDELMDFLAAGMDKSDVISMDIIDEKGSSTNMKFKPAFIKNAENAKMTYDEFKQYSLDALSRIFCNEGDEVKASISHRSVDEQHEAIHVVRKKDGTSMSNGFLVEPFYEDYKLGEPLGDLVLEMVKTIEGNDELLGDVDLNELNKFETGKKSLFFRLLNYEQNKKMLEGHVYKVIGDLALVLYMLTAVGNGGMASYKVPASIVEEWNLSPEYVLDLAIENAAKLFRPYIVPIEAFNFSKETAHTIPDKHRYFMDDDFELEKPGTGAFSFFQDEGLNDATVVFYKGTLHRMATILDDDLYIIMPETDYAVIHAKRRFPIKQLRKIFRRINADPQRYKSGMLSEKIFIYTRADDKINVFWD